MCEERSWHREEVEVLTDEEVARLIEEHSDLCKLYPSR